MPTAQRVEGTGFSHTRQGRRRAILGLLVSTSPFVPFAAPAQQLPFTVTIVDWQSQALQRQQRMYRGIPAGHEVLFCVDTWTKDAARDGFERITITSTRKEDTGNRHNIDQTALKCRDSQGAALPTIHTHSEGNCQPSPTDVLMIAARGGPFDGIQCGEHHVIWVFAWQIKAIASSVYASQRPP